MRFSTVEPVPIPLGPILCQTVYNKIDPFTLCILVIVSGGCPFLIDTFTLCETSLHQQLLPEGATLYSGVTYSPASFRYLLMEPFVVILFQDLTYI